MPRASLSRIFSSIAWDVLRQRSRSLHSDALALVAAKGLPLVVKGQETIPVRGPFLLVTNHYTRPGLGVWWSGLAVTSVLPVDLHWLITGAWTGSPITPLTRWLLTRVAQIYGLTTMPPISPDPRPTANGAAAVRRVITYARQAHEPVIALSPEGRDFPGSRLGDPPPGAGRFMLHLAQILKSIVPVGVYEDSPALCLNFGPPFTLHLPVGLSTAKQDLLASRIVMNRIAALLPAYLRGEYRGAK
jgi:1-acyl-sn-glycerol-3-phosphate acyltransferase